MNGAESLVRTLVAGGVDVCFTNPGTSEMHFVAALDRVDGMRCVLGLFEGVVTGAADGYYRMKGTPAGTLLHLGPGLGNGPRQVLFMLHELAGNLTVRCSEDFGSKNGGVHGSSPVNCHCRNRNAARHLDG